jgi:hypothetical protein
MAVLSKAVGSNFELAVEKILLQRGFVRQVNVGGPNGRNSVDYLWRGFLTEVKSGLSIDKQQLQAISSRASEQGLRFACIFLNKPAGSVIRKIEEKGGSITWFFE